jgi:hypothetical protein
VAESDTARLAPMLAADTDFEARFDSSPALNTDLH